MTKEERLAAFEEMLAVILERYETTTERSRQSKTDSGSFPDYMTS